MRTYLDVFRLCFEDQLSYRQIALALGIGRSTVTELVARFNSLNLAWPLSPEVSLVTLDQALLPGRDYQTKRVLPDWLKLDIELKDPKLTKQLLWQEYQAEHGRAALRISVCPASCFGIVRPSDLFFVTPHFLTYFRWFSQTFFPLRFAC